MYQKIYIHYELDSSVEQLKNKFFYQNIKKRPNFGMNIIISIII